MSADPAYQAWRCMRLWDIVIEQEFNVCTNYAVGKIDSIAADILNRADLFDQLTAHIPTLIHDDASTERP